MTPGSEIGAHPNMRVFGLSGCVGLFNFEIEESFHLLNFIISFSCGSNFTVFGHGVKWDNSSELQSKGNHRKVVLNVLKAPDV